MSHTKPGAIKTDAPYNVIWDILRLQAEKKPPIKPPEEQSPAARILSITVEEETRSRVDFDVGMPSEPTNEAPLDKQDEHENATKKRKRPRFLPNPEKDWGPKKAALMTSGRNAPPETR